MNVNIYKVNLCYVFNSDLFVYFLPFAACYLLWTANIYVSYISLHPNNFFFFLLPFLTVITNILFTFSNQPEFTCKLYKQKKEFWIEQIFLKAFDKCDFICGKSTYWYTSRDREDFPCMNIWTRVIMVFNAT
jgi:hypothetical protein